VEVVFLEMTLKDEYEYLKEVLHKVRIRERGYTEQEAVEKIIFYYKRKESRRNKSSDYENDFKGGGN
jgi:hypothetical protein